MTADEPPFADIEATLKKAAAALRGADVPFLLGGSLASWARGGPETRHDLDLMIKREDVERALDGADGGRDARRGPAGGVARQGVGWRCARGPDLLAQGPARSTTR